MCNDDDNILLLWLVGMSKFSSLLANNRYMLDNNKHFSFFRTKQFYLYYLISKIIIKCLLKTSVKIH